jgi:hypothetical protein
VLRQQRNDKQQARPQHTREVGYVIRLCKLRAATCGPAAAIACVCDLQGLRVCVYDVDVSATVAVPTK